MNTAEYDLIGVFALPIFLLLAGSIIGYFIRILVALRTSRRQTTLDLYEDFHSPEFLKCRIDSEIILTRESESNIDTLRKNLTREEWESISQLIHWFEKVELYRKAKLIDSKILELALGRYIIHWHNTYYDQLVNQLDPSSPFQKLINNFDALFKNIGNQNQ